MTMRSLPNLLSAMRMLCAAVLPLLTGDTRLWLCVYAVAGISDVLDGYVARRWHLESSIGAMLDSGADTLFMLASMASFLRIFPWPSWLTAWVCALAFIKLTTAGLGWCKYRTVAFIHTRMNKISGIVVFFTPPAILLSGSATWAVLPCLIASFASIEELCITIVSSNHSPNVPSLRAVGRATSREDIQSSCILRHRIQRTGQGVYSSDNAAGRDDVRHRHLAGTETMRETGSDKSDAGPERTHDDV
ncbi:MAG: CDP-alcohol phosphatidyltransferase family protein [Bifidobacterium crudilactis]|jgi:cardiolipin synthase